MRHSRREIVLLIPAVAAARGLRAAEPARLGTRVTRYEDLPVSKRDGNSFRPIVEGALHDGHAFEAHATELAPGGMPHGSHSHKHEEMFLVREGKVEVTVNGKGTRLGPGGVAFIGSGDNHGMRNVGGTTAKYFVIALGKDS